MRRTVTSEHARFYVGAAGGGGRQLPQTSALPPSPKILQYIGAKKERSVIL